ncbi:hypothetical protein ACFQGT_12170 [Natrialbaceae archaeon GCM10025810]|uniref:DUF7115 domain-containing protein n=1 Tax=Halovalidus salilacus TaxID=3075124 RepID=UPI00360FCCA8
MSVPGIVHSTLDDEEIAARVSLGGEDELFITPSRTIVYRAEGLLSDESVDELPHDADRLSLSEGRRKTRFTLEYALDGTREFTIPSSKTDEVLHPVLAGVLTGNGITDPGETVLKTYRFSELTLVVTSDRLVKHIGEPVWDDDFEEYRYEDVTNLAFEDGSVATQIVLAVDGRPHRIKAPNEEAGDLRTRLERALFEYHDVSSLEELNETLGEDEEEPAVDDDPAAAFGEGVDPLEANPPAPDDFEAEFEEKAAIDDAADGSAARASGRTSASASTDESTSAAGSDESAERSARDDPATRSLEDAAESLVRSETESADADASEDARTTLETADAESDPDEATATESVDDRFEGSGFESATPDPAPEVLERLESLEAAVARQSDLIEAQQETIEQLIAELRRGR